MNVTHLNCGAMREIPADGAGRGYDPADVTDIVLTHLGLDHSGGLPDLPAARVHVHDAEYRAAMAVSSALPAHTVRVPAGALGAPAPVGDVPVVPAGHDVVRLRRGAPGRAARGRVARAARRAHLRAQRGGGEDRRPLAAAHR